MIQTSLGVYYSCPAVSEEGESINYKLGVSVIFRQKEIYAYHMGMLI